jgi:hypothetical protein
VTYDPSGLSSFVRDKYMFWSGDDGMVSKIGECEGSGKMPSCTESIFVSQGNVGLEFFR